MKVIFIVEAGSHFGLGHLMRSRPLLLEMADRGFETEIWIKGEREVLEGKKWPEGMRRRVFSEAVKEDVVLDAIFMKTDNSNIDWLVLDGYGFSSTRLFPYLQDRGTHLLLIDDVPERVVATDILLNQNTVNIDHYKGKSVQAKKFLLGPSYALIDSSYKEKKWTGSDIGNIENILLSFGGVDKSGWTYKTLLALDALPHALTVEIVVGPFCASKKDLKAYSGRHKLNLHEGLSSLSELMQRTDLLISGAGSTVWQACCVGVPLIAVKTISNQALIKETLDINKAALCIDPEKMTSYGKTWIRDFIALFHEIADPEVRIAMSNRARGLVDGNGPSRVVSCLEAMKMEDS